MVRIHLVPLFISGYSIKVYYVGLPNRGCEFDSHYPLFLAPWLNGYNAGLSRRVVRVRIPLESLILPCSEMAITQHFDCCISGSSPDGVTKLEESHSGLVHRS